MTKEEQITLIFSSKFRTHNCGELGKRNAGEEVKLTGWVDSIRQHGKVGFINLRDRYGITQIVVRTEELLEKVKELGSEWVVSVNGSVVQRPEGMENKNIATGEIDVEINDMEIVSKSKVPPFVTKDLGTASKLLNRDMISVKEDTRLKYRYIDIRREAMQKTLIRRSEIEQKIREYLNRHEFINIETPILGRSTPEGARDFLVPSRLHPGKFYSLIQSPQIYKQLLMIAGLDRYYQFAKCFRDEDQRKDRQLEFTQLDIECSFVNEENIFALVEELMKSVFEEILNITIETPFEKMTYRTALETYGTDKPDIRYDLKLEDVTAVAGKTEFNAFKEAIVKCVIWEGDLSRKEVDELTNVAKEYNMELFCLKNSGGNLSGPLAKFFTPMLFKELLNELKKKRNIKLDCVSTFLFSAGEEKRVCEVLGGVRNALINKLPAKDGYIFVWITDFPMFEINLCTQNIVASHHIFTMPKNPEVLDKEPLSAIGRLYDLVLNGVELGSGSIRVHIRELQEKLLEIIGISKKLREKDFECLLSALEYGAPPHGGIALGYDRLVAILSGEESIHNVIAFPKTLSGAGLLEGIPSEVTQAQLDELHIEIKKDNNEEQTTKKDENQK